MELRFTVWQFVRLMVHLEELEQPSPNEAALLHDWREAWTPLDGELARLAQEDPAAYGAMMMDRDVVFEDATTEQAQTAAEGLKAVMKRMDAALEHPEGEDPELLESLKFERRELRQLSRKLERQTKAD